MIIDSHAHIWPDKIADKAGLHLQDVFKTKIVVVPTLSNLLRYMDKNGIEVTVVSSVATRPDQVPSINKWLRTIVSDRVKVLAAFHPFYENWESELECIREFALGVKLQPEFQEYYVDDDRLTPMYEKFSAFKMPVLFHCGKELSGTMLVRSSPERMEKVIAQFPNMKIIAAHFGGYLMWDEVEKHLLGKNVIFDTSYVLPSFEKPKMESWIKRHGADNILFGTDFPLVDQKSDIDYINSLNLPAETKNKIFSANAKTIFGI